MKRVPENGHDRHHHHPNEEYLVHSFFPALPHSDDMILEEVFVRYVFFVFLRFPENSRCSGTLQS